MLFTVMLDAVYMFSMCFTCFLVHVCMLLTLFTAIQEAVYRPCVLFTVVLGSLHPIFCILYVFYMLFDCFTPPPPPKRFCIVIYMCFLMVGKGRWGLTKNL